MISAETGRGLKCCACARTQGRGPRNFHDGKGRNGDIALGRTGTTGSIGHGDGINPAAADRYGRVTLPIAPSIINKIAADRQGHGAIALVGRLLDGGDGIGQVAHNICGAGRATLQVCDRNRVSSTVRDGNFVRDTAR